VFMVRVTLVIFALLGMFILNACGNSNLNHPANIDDQEAVIYKTGLVSGRASPTVERVLNDKNEIEIKKDKNIFQEVDIDANFDKKKVSLKAKVLNSNNELENVDYEGEFDETGFALLTPKNSKIKTKAVVRCVDSCDKVVADVGIKHMVDGQEKYESEQFELKDDKVSRIVPEPVREIYPETSNLTDSATPAPAPSKKPTPLPPARLPPPVFSSVTDQNVSEIDQGDDEEDMVEPAIDSGKYQNFMDEKLLDGNSDMKSLLSAFSLGDKYPGQAIGFYNKGSLQKGTDITSNIKSLLLPGFISIDRSAGVHYGSGFLVKMLEEIGSMYSKAFAGQAFQVSAVSKKAGGPCGHHSHQNGLDADIPLPRTSNGQIDFEKIWFLVKSFYFEENKVRATLPADKKDSIGIMILSPIKMKALCTYLKANNKKDISGPFAKLYLDTLATKDKNNRKLKHPYYPHEDHIHMRAMCTPHNKSCTKATVLSYTPSKFGVCQ
jgi:murein endopeptidase